MVSTKGEYVLLDLQYFWNFQNTTVTFKKHKIKSLLWHNKCEFQRESLHLCDGQQNVIFKILEIMKLNMYHIN